MRCIEHWTTVLGKADDKYWTNTTGNNPPSRCGARIQYAQANYQRECEEENDRIRSQAIKVMEVRESFERGLKMHCVTHPNGDTSYIRQSQINVFCKQHGIDPSALIQTSRITNGRRYRRSANGFIMDELE